MHDWAEYWFTLISTFSFLPIVLLLKLSQFSQKGFITVNFVIKLWACVLQTSFNTLLLDCDVYIIDLIRRMGKSKQELRLRPHYAFSTH